MTLKEARAVRDFVRGRGVHCTVPHGHGPDRYFARIILCGGHCLDFNNMTEARSYFANQLKMRRKSKRELAAKMAIRASQKSPLDYMIDKACGRI